MAKEGIAAGGDIDVKPAFQEVLKTTLIHDGLACDICEAPSPSLCALLLSASDEPVHVKLVGELCVEHQINIVKANGKKLGEWLGLCESGGEGKPFQVVGCICVVFKNYGKDSRAKDVTKEYFKYKK